MEFTAKKKFMRVTPRKLRLVADTVRGKGIQTAIDSLRFSEKRWSKDVMKLLQSALNNATQSRGVNVDLLFVKQFVLIRGPQ